MKTSKYIVWGFLIVVALGLAGIIARGCNQVNKSIDNSTVSYEEYQDIYNTCEKLNTDLCNMEKLPDADVMFQQFSKAQRVNQLRTTLNRWVNDYNAKSRMITRAVWKSSKLPYELKLEQYSCY